MSKKSVKETESAIEVIVRFRPLIDWELKKYGKYDRILYENVSTLVIDPSGKRSSNPVEFNFDRIFQESTQQEEIFEFFGDEVVKNLFNGINGSVVAYGQTSSGKTHSMYGEGRKKGVVPRILEKIFDFHEKKSSKTKKISIEIQFFEIYLEKIIDLLHDPENEKNFQKIRIIENKKNGFSLLGVTSENVHNKKQAVHCLNRGNLLKTMSGSDMNMDSSRSHTIFSIQIRQQNFSTFEILKSKLFLVDLAGSERVCKTKCTGERFKESKNINKSLSVLGKVIYSLSVNSTHIPFRESTLTKILKESLGGNSRTVLLLTCSPCNLNIEETISTLRFGAICKNLKNKLRRNVTFDRDSKMRRLIKELRDENARLRLGLMGKDVPSVDEGDKKKVIVVENKKYYELMEKLYEKDERIMDLEDDLYRLKQKLFFTKINSVAEENLQLSTSSMPELSNRILEINFSSEKIDPIESSEEEEEEEVGEVPNKAVLKCGVVEIYDGDDGKWEKKWLLLQKGALKCYSGIQSLAVCFEIAKGKLFYIQINSFRGVDMHALEIENVKNRKKYFVKLENENERKKWVKCLKSFQ